MKKVITYGTFDMLHYGHLRLLERAKALGDYLIVGITSDDYDKSRGKINVQQPLVERIDAVKATGLADEIIVEEYEGQKIDDIKRLGVDVFTVGTDWLGRFDYLKEYCDVIYLERTQGVSSSDLRSELDSLRIGVVGNIDAISKLINESRFVNGANIVSVLTKNPRIIDICSKNGIAPATDFEVLLDKVDAVYIATPPSSITIRSASPYLRESMFFAKAQ